jgi:hypothetical protein
MNTKVNLINKIIAAILICISFSATTNKRIKYIIVFNSQSYCFPCLKKLITYHKKNKLTDLEIVYLKELAPDIEYLKERLIYQFDLKLDSGNFCRFNDASINEKIKLGNNPNLLIIENSKTFFLSYLDMFGKKEIDIKGRFWTDYEIAH